MNIPSLWWTTTCAPLFGGLCRGLATSPAKIHANLSAKVTDLISFLRKFISLVTSEYEFQFFANVCWELFALYMEHLHKGESKPNGLESNFVATIETEFFCIPDKGQ